MSLKSALGRIRNELKATFHVKPYNAADDRKKVVRLLENAEKQYPKSKAPNKLWSIGYNDAVRFTLRVNGNVIPIGNEDTNTLPKDEFEAFLKDLKAAVNAGELDSEIKTALLPGGEGSSVGNGRKSTQRTGSTGDKPWQKRSDWASLDIKVKQGIGAYHRNGRNPDGSVIADVGHKPDAPYKPKK